MKLGLKLLIALMVLAVVPVLFVSRYATSYFHHFTKTEQEEQMARSARLVGELFRSVEDPEARRRVVEAFAERSGWRYRFFDSEAALVLDEGDVGAVEFSDNPDVAEALRTGDYAARWWMRPDGSRLYYFTSVPVTDREGRLIGVAQTVAHTGGITRALLALHRRQTRGILVVTGASVVFALGFAFGLTRRLRRLRRGAEAFAKGGDADEFAVAGRDEVGDLAEGFREMAEELKRRQAYNRDFVLTTLHELKTPLTAMHGAADILETREGLELNDRRRFARNIRVQSDRLLALVRELQTLTSLDVDLPEEARVEVATGPWLREALERIRPALRHPVEVEEGSSATISAVPDRLEQALENLLRNADRYQPEGGAVRIRCEAGGGEWGLWVEDGGEGIPEENLDRIFDRYFTTATSAGEGERGRGLGLAVVKRIVEHHRGRVAARNLPGSGASVGFRLPLA